MAVSSAQNQRKDPATGTGMNYFEHLAHCQAPGVELIVGAKKQEYSSDHQVLTYHELTNSDVIYDHWPGLRDLRPGMIQFATITSQQPGYLRPHRDHGDLKCVINWYFSSNHSTTAFYVERGQAQPYCAVGETHAKIYLAHQIQKVGEFQARDGDIYLLNVSEIHSVQSPQAGTRCFITMSWKDRSYTEVRAASREIFNNYDVSTLRPNLDTDQ